VLDFKVTPPALTLGLPAAELEALLNALFPEVVTALIVLSTNIPKRALLFQKTLLLSCFSQELL
jgi:hypothetical protein